MEKKKFQGVNIIILGSDINILGIMKIYEEFAQDCVNFVWDPVR